MSELWLGYDNLTIACDQVAAVLIYQAALERRVRQSYGRTPANIRSVVVLTDGRYLPSSWPADELRRRVAGWRASAAG